jgi:ABC-type sugar transport system substrate-binding protein
MSRYLSPYTGTWASAIACALATASLAACSNTVGDPATASNDRSSEGNSTTNAQNPELPDGACEGKKVGLANISTTIPFLASMSDAFTEEAERLGMEATVLNANLDNATLVGNVKTLTAQGVDVLSVTSSSPTAPVAAVNQAWAADVPVLALNAPLDDGAKVITYVGVSDFQFGQSLGNLLMQALPEGGKVAVIMGPLGGTPQVQRLAGMEDVLEGHPEFEIIAKPVDEFDNSKNLAVTQDLLSKYPEGELDAVVAQGPQMYVGANYAQDNGRDDIKFIAGDYSQQVEDAIRSGALYGTVNQSPRL